MKNKFKTIAIMMTLLMAAALLLSACSPKTERVGWNETNNPNQFKAEYQLFTGNELKEIPVGKDQTLKLEYNLEVKKGTLTAKLLDGNKKVVFEFKPGEKGTKDIKAAEAGLYTISINGKATEGMYNFTWQIQ